jgi:hypothetical protein
MKKCAVFFITGKFSLGCPINSVNLKISKTEFYDPGYI